MSTATMSSLPFQTGGAVVVAGGRLVMWAVAQYMRQPLRNTAVAGMIGLSSMASSNALYFQTHHHPAPLFGTTDQQVASVAEESVAVPAPRPKTLKLPDTTTTGSVETVVRVPAITNDDVVKLQLKLEALKFYDGKADGLYGPRTAKAIRAFEAANGLATKGQLTPDILKSILSAAIVVEAPVVETAPEPVRTPLALAAETAEPETTASLPAPAPLAAIEVAPATTKTTGRVIPDSPEEALDLVADTAQDALDTIIDGVQTMTMSSPAPVKRVVQTIAVKAKTQAAQAEAQPATKVATAQPLPELLPPASLATPAVTVPATNEREMVAQVQRGLSSLGFLHGAIDGVAGEATAKAIRNFEVYYNYNVTGRVTPELVRLLVQNGAVI